MIAAPAGASVIIQNYMEADLTAAPPCFVKVAGTDASTAVASFDGTNTTGVDGVNLTEELIGLQGMTGDRVVYTDMVRYQNTCGQPINVVLTTSTVSGDWSNIAAEIWISNIENPTGVDPNVDVPADEWNDDNITVSAGTPAGAFSDSTGVVTVASGAEIQGAFVVSADQAYVAGTATVNWVAQATLS